LASQVVFEILPDPDVRERRLTRSTAHLDLWPEGDVINPMIDSGTVTLFQTDPARSVARLVFNLSAPGSADPSQPHPILGNLQIRQALRYAVEPGRLNAEAFNDRGRVIYSELHQLGCNIAPFPYNPGLAAALLDDAGWVLVDPEVNPVRECRGCGTAEEGTPLVLQSYTYVEAPESVQRAHELIEEMLAEVGVKLERQVAEGGKLWDTWQGDGLEIRGNFDLDLWDDGYFGVDPTIYLTDLFDPRAIPTRDNPVAGLNVSRYRNPNLANLFDALHTPLPNNRRRALLCELALTLDQDLPQIPLVAIPDLYAISIDLEGVAPHIYDTVTWNASEWRLVRPVAE
jgi:ABC-type transport system substrate-binding protein